MTNPNTCPETNLFLYGDMGIGNWIILQPLLEDLQASIKCNLVIVDFNGSTPFSLIDPSPLSFDAIILKNFFKNRRLNGFAQFVQLSLICFVKFPGNNIVFGRHTYSPRNLILRLATRPRASFSNVRADDPRLSVYKRFGFKIRIYDEENHEYYNNLHLMRLIYPDIKTNFRKTFPYSCNGFSYKELLPNLSTKFAVIQPMSSAIQNWKRWPASYWARLANKLVELDYNVVIVGSLDEKKENDALLLEANNPNVRNTSGELSLFQLGCLVQMAALTVTADGVLGHISSYFDTLSFTLIGPGGVGRSPMGRSSHVIRVSCACNQSNSILLKTQEKIERCGGECMKNLKPENVFNTIKSTLGRTEFKL